MTGELKDNHSNKNKTNEKKKIIHRGPKTALFEVEINFPQGHLKNSGHPKSPFLYQLHIVYMFSSSVLHYSCLIYKVLLNHQWTRMLTTWVQKGWGLICMLAMGPRLLTYLFKLPLFSCCHSPLTPFNATSDSEHTLK